MAAGHASTALPESTRPEVLVVLAHLEDRGVTRLQAAEIAETGIIPAPSPRAADGGTPAAA